MLNLSEAELYNHVVMWGVIFFFLIIFALADLIVWSYEKVRIYRGGKRVHRIYVGML